MRIHLWFPTLTVVALLGFTVGSAEAGSFFGPCCYGADYTYKYPNRSHNVFGCGPGSHCQACHPFFRHHLFRKNQGVVVNEGTPNGAVSPHPTSVGAGSVYPQVQTGSVSFPPPRSAGPVAVEPPTAQPSPRPPF